MAEDKKLGTPVEEQATAEPPQPKDATRAEKEEIVYLDISELHTFKNHPFGIHQPALMRPREGGDYGS